jgi:hypothetical protein
LAYFRDFPQGIPLAHFARTELLAVVAQNGSLRELLICHTEIAEITENYSLRE